MKTPKQPVLHNLEEWRSVDGVATKVATLLWNVPYGMAKGMSDKAKSAPHTYGTFWKIVPNVPKKKEVQVKQAA